MPSYFPKVALLASVFVMSGVAPSAAQDSVDITVQGTIMSPIALAEMKVLTEGSFGSIARSPTTECNYSLRDGDELVYYADGGSEGAVPGFNSAGCGALNDRVQTPTISYTCPISTYVTIRTQRSDFNEADSAEFRGLWGSGPDLSRVSGQRTNQGGGVFDFSLFCSDPGTGEATRNVTLYGNVVVTLAPGSPEQSESFSINLPLEIQY